MSTPRSPWGAVYFTNNPYQKFELIFATTQQYSKRAKTRLGAI